MKNVAKSGKLVPKFQPEPFQVIERKGSMVIARRGEETKARDCSHFKQVRSAAQHQQVQGDEQQVQGDEQEVMDTNGRNNEPLPTGPSPTELKQPGTRTPPETRTPSPDVPRPPMPNTTDPPKSPPKIQGRPKRNKKSPVYLRDYQVNRRKTDRDN